MAAICLVSTIALMTRSFILELIVVSEEVTSITTSSQAKARVGLEITTVMEDLFKLELSWLGSVIAS